MKILILYTEIAGYVIASLKFFLRQNPKAEIHLVKFPINSEAPFEFEKTERLHFYERTDFDKKILLDFAQNLSPDAILCSGWIDKDYVFVCKKFYSKIPTVMILDNHWLGSLKQRILKVLAPFTLHKTFSKVWVPGEPQKQYALELSYKPNQISTGFYCGDVTFFSELFDKFKIQKSVLFPKRFVCVARYIPAKNLDLLWDSFAELYDAGELMDWELWCLGAGADFDKRKQHKGIVHKGFVQPNQMSEIIAETGVFVLPSKFEPWAVVVHEFASAGFPLLLSKSVGAGSEFLKEEINGFSFSAENKNELKEKLKKFAGMSQDDFTKFSEESVRLSQNISPESWSNSLINIITNKPI